MEASALINDRICKEKSKQKSKGGESTIIFVFYLVRQFSIVFIQNIKLYFKLKLLI
jgi:hypothetical protein